MFDCKIAYSDLWYVYRNISVLWLVVNFGVFVMNQLGYVLDQSRINPIHEWHMPFKNTR
jgi:hypothetical protein